MPNYSDEKIEGCYLYFTLKCIVEAMHAHADPNHNQNTAAKFWVYEDGESKLIVEGNLTKKQVREIQRYIKNNINTMKEKWADKVSSGDIEEIEYMNKR